MCTADVNKFALHLAGMQDVSAWRTLGLKPGGVRGAAYGRQEPAVPEDQPVCHHAYLQAHRQARTANEAVVHPGAFAAHPGRHETEGERRQEERQQGEQERRAGKIRFGKQSGCE
ncbi:uncharacterized protein [Penaeus vannamei]|uniref:uncharacterized protein n=1 Tax=Penaeus vannamei TaxID=6689 RepID=UPI00387F7049